MKPLACPTSAKQSGTPSTETWLSDPQIHAKRPGVAIERELENWKASVAGTYLDDDRRAFGIVLDRDFADYDGLRRKLEPSAVLRVVLRPACHSRAEIESARRVLENREWHPRASSTSIVYHFDASISAFAVGVADSQPEVAKVLEQRLGKLVRTHLNQVEPQRERRTPRP